MNLKQTPLAILIAVLLAAILQADELQRDAEVAEQINAANELLRGGHVEKAIQAYDSIVPTARYRDQLSYNAAVAAYRAGNLPAAIEKFTATSGSVDSQLAARSHFNLGNCHYASALELADADKPAAIARLQKAINHYRGGLHIDPSLTDARANMELAVQLIKRWTAEEAQSSPQQPGEPNPEQPEPQQSPDPRPQDGQQQDDAGQQNPNEDPAAQQPSAETSEDPSNQQPQQPADQEASPSKSPPSSDTSDPDRDAKPADDAQSPTDAARHNAGESQSESAHPESGNQAQDRTNANQPQPSDGDSQPASRSAEESDSDDPSAGEQNVEEAPPVPSGELTTATKEAQEEEANTEVTVLDQNAMGQMNREEALKLLQAVRDRDMLRRLQQEQRNRARRVPVEQDW